MLYRTLAFAGIVLLYVAAPFSIWANATSIHQITDVIRPALVLGTTGLLLLGVLNFFLKNLSRTVLLASVPGLFLLACHFHIMAFLVISAGLIIVFLIDRGVTYDAIARLIIAASFVQIASSMNTVWTHVWNEAGHTRRYSGLESIILTKQPSIIHTVFDGYGDPQILRSVYGYDNSHFLAALRDRGFVLFQDVLAPYNQTLPTMASILNAHPVADLLPGGVTVGFRRALGQAVHGGSVVNLFRRNGYQIAATPIGFGDLEFPGTEILRRTGPALSGLEVALASPFSQLPPVWYFNGLLRSSLAPGIVKELSEPFFLYQHVIAPHPPFIIDVKGNDILAVSTSLSDASHFVQDNPVLREQYIEGYTEKAKFVENSYIRQFDALPNIPMIIIVQGDHGPGAHMDHDSAENTCLAERMRTFLAIYTNIPGLQDVIQTAANEQYNTINIYRTLLSNLSDSQLEELRVKPKFLEWRRPWVVQNVEPAALGFSCAPRN